MVPFLIAAGVILALGLLFPPSKTTVILLDNNQNRNGVVVTTEGGVIELDRPYTQTVLVRSAEAPEPASGVDPASLREKYAPVFEALPPAPITLLFYFESGTTRLTPESMAQSASLVELIKKREPCVVDIVGHTDTVDTRAYNYELGVQRAIAVKSFLDAQKVRMKRVSVTSHGEGDLLVPTRDGVDEPRNRRVEVIVR